MTSMEVKSEVVDHPIKLRGTCITIIAIDYSMDAIFKFSIFPKNLNEIKICYF